MKIATYQNISLFSFFCVIVFLPLFLFVTIFFSPDVANSLGQKLFLDFHQNNLAKNVLELTKNKNSQTHYLLGRIYFVQDISYKSIDSYTKAIELNSQVKEYYYGRGLAYGFTSPLFYQDSENDFKKYIELDNKDYHTTGEHAYGAWAGYNDLAWIHYLQGEFDDAEKVARIGLDLSGQNPWLMNILGIILLEKKDCSNATKYLASAKKLINQISTKQFGEAYSGDASDFWQKGKQDMENAIGENLKICEKMSYTDR